MSVDDDLRKVKQMCWQLHARAELDEAAVRRFDCEVGQWLPDRTPKRCCGGLRCADCLSQGRGNGKGEAESIRCPLPFF